MAKMSYNCEISQELLQSAKSHHQPVTHALRSSKMEAIGVPQGYDASEPGNIFEALSTDPDRLKLDAFLYGISHQHHLALERTRQTNTETAGKKIVSEIHNFLEEDVDLKDTHFMCIAGELSASLEVWCPKYEENLEWRK
ncbi:uncharacterized protein LOC124443691 isoform X2 [Xenia sp. Carnegie-2017]|uniref:uncharacterized protein LOC124443691 isoform X2 n=1 Tax=Xenia sp. Carnegie-2017 TaxID=2897299 RepID=UPI001F043B48|nr:uncharacterized protein LOC124443691 isoform X2 [Xenia sp. Carnegie-2017]